MGSLCVKDIGLRKVLTRPLILVEAESRMSWQLYGVYILELKMSDVIGVEIGCFLVGPWYLFTTCIIR